MKKTVEKVTKHKRPSWDEYFLQMIELVGSRGTCDRGRSGAILVKDKRILATGYVGSPVGLPHCDEVGHEMHTLTNEDGTVSRHCLRTAHAELNAIANAARHGVVIDGATLYCKMVPCYTCAKTIINAGIKRVVAFKNYHLTEQSKNVFKKSGVKLEIVNKEIESYKDQ
ncbi:MAG: cytidine/deoxycytidylate deaminase family protein [Candidatus Paceibacterota bacterium]|jgi:dCMP deaminase